MILAGVLAIIAVDNLTGQPSTTPTTVTTTVVVTDTAAVDLAAALAAGAIERAARAVGRVAPTPSASAEPCRKDSPTCQLYGRCTKTETGCLALGSSCKQAEVCRLMGQCTAEGGACVAGTDEDCRAAWICQRDQACSAEQGRCRPAPTASATAAP